MQPDPLLKTKLYIPPVRPELVLRPRLIERLNAGLSRKLTLISAPAGFGKTTLASEWVASLRFAAAANESQVVHGTAWLSLDERDSDPTRFLTYLVATLQTIAAQQSPVGNIGEGVLGLLQSPQPPPIESILTALLNEITTILDDFVLVLDDYHVIDAKPVDNALTFLLEHLPPQMHLVITTREDPHLPLARLRVKGQMTELRDADLRFTTSEAAEFLNQAMGLNLSEEDIAALEIRTEGWIAGLQLAALALQAIALQGTISMQEHRDARSFIEAFTGSHRFVLDYLVEEVLQQQSENIQTFLLRTSILDRLCGPLCDAVRFGPTESPSPPEGDAARFGPAGSAGRSVRAAMAGADATVHKSASLHPNPSASGQETLEYLEHANLFIIPLDNERRWYRYHALFCDLLRQRLHQSVTSSTGDEWGGVDELHKRASVWYEDNGLEIEAFHHAAAANDVERAERLIEGEGTPLHWRGAAAPVMNWLASLPTKVLNARPSLWVTWASALVFAGQTSSIEQKLQAAEAALQGSEPGDRTQDLVGHIAALRAMMAVPLHQVETIIAQASRALELLHPDNLPVRTAATWTLGYAYELQGERAKASRAYAQVISNSQASGNFMFTIAATTSLANIQEAENQLYLAAESHRRALQLAGDPPLPFACASYLGLARVLYEWNDLDAAQQHGEQSAQLGQQIEGVDTPAASGVFLARVKLAQGDVAGAAAILAKAEQFLRQHSFMHLESEVAAAQVLTLLCQGDLAAAAHLAEKYELPISQARVHLARGLTSAALAVLEPLRRQAEAKGWKDERLKVMVLQSVALQADGEKEEAVQLLGDALALAEPGGFIRIFVDEGFPMAQLLSETAVRGIMPDHTGKLLAAFEAEEQPVLAGHQARTGKSEDKPDLTPASPAQPLIEPLSQRELEVLRLVAQGLSNREISERLFLALGTVKGHNRRIYGKLGVKNRTQAINKARSLNILPPQ